MLEKLKKDFENNRSGHKSNRSYVEKNHPEFYAGLVNRFDIPKYDILTFQEKIWMLLNNKTEIQTCAICSNTPRFDGILKGYKKYCSLKCLGKSDANKEKKKLNSLKKYGTDHPMGVAEFRKKISDTKLSKTDEEKSKIQEKLKTTLIERYGVENPNQGQFVEKRIESFKANNAQWKKSYKKTSLEKYGVEHPWSSLEVRNVYKDTMMKLYGADSPNKVKEIQKRILATRKRNYMNKFPNTKFIEIRRDFFDIECEICKQTYTISRALFRFRYRNNYTCCMHCNPYTLSKPEKEIKEFISELESIVQFNRRKIIAPLELDIYIEGKKLAIEFNGTYWHSELMKNKDYHLDKTEKCESLGIQLIQVYEDDWLYKKDIVKSRIRNLLGKNNTRIFARKCKIVNPTPKECRTFLIENHIQGSIGSKWKYGLSYEGKLVSLMVLGSGRDAIGKHSSEIELLRFCNAKNTTVIGAASRLFAHFLEDNPSVKTVISFADRSWSIGALYEKLGFKFVENSAPNYWYVVDGMRMHRYNFAKHILVREGYDPSKTEREIMSERGIYRIYDSGSRLYKYTRQ